MISGIPAPSVQWYKDGLIVGSGKSQLVLLNINKHNAGNYSCVVQNQYGTISHTSLLEVYGLYTISLNAFIYIA